MVSIEYCQLQRQLSTNGACECVISDEAHSERWEYVFGDEPVDAATQFVVSQAHGLEFAQRFPRCRHSPCELVVGEGHIGEGTCAVEKVRQFSGKGVMVKIGGFQLR